MSAALTIGQVAEASGLAPDTIRYYERTGVLPPAPRRGNSYRGYPPEHVETLRFARRLRELGLAPDAMADLIRLFHDGTCRQMRDALVENCQAVLEHVRRRRLELERAEDQLNVVLSGLAALSVDHDTLSTLEPCSCVDVVEREQAESTLPQPQMGRAMSGDRRERHV